MKRIKVTLGLTNYSGEMCGTIFKDSVAVLPKKENEEAMAQGRMINRLKLLVPGTMFEEIDADAPAQEREPEAPISPPTPPPAPEPATKSDAVIFAEDPDESEDETEEPEEAEPADEE